MFAIFRKIFINDVLIPTGIGKFFLCFNVICLVKSIWLYANGALVTT